MNQPTLSHLIALGEGFTTEFKRSMPSDLGREICAFANATGGVILIGVDDAGTVTGVRDHNRLKSRVQSVARGGGSGEPRQRAVRDGAGAARQTVLLRRQVLRSRGRHLPADVP